MDNWVDGRRVAVGLALIGIGCLAAYFGTTVHPLAGPGDIREDYTDVSLPAIVGAIVGLVGLVVAIGGMLRNRRTRRT